METDYLRLCGNAGIVRLYIHLYTILMVNNGSVNRGGGNAIKHMN